MTCEFCGSSRYVRLVGDKATGTAWFRVCRKCRVEKGWSDKIIKGQS